MPCSLSRTLVINLPETMAAYSLVKILISRIEKKKKLGRKLFEDFARYFSEEGYQYYAVSLS